VPFLGPEDERVVVMDDPADPRLDGYRHLTDAALRRSWEAEHGLFVAEGALAIEALAASVFPLHSVLALARRLEALIGVPLPGDVPVYVAEAALLEAIAGFEVHRGLLALGRRLAPLDAGPLLRASRLSVVAEGINDQENLGAIFRNAAAFGAGAVLLDPSCADPLYRRTVRVSLGHALRIPFARVAPWPGVLLDPVGPTILALTPDPTAEPIDGVAAEVGAGPVALLVGAERHGLSAPALALGRRVRIPMAPGVDSLNVAAAMAVALHCVARLG
jgi:tRNA G18 (ribose-2'-O)-methylase SpoU